MSCVFVDSGDSGGLSVCAVFCCCVMVVSISMVVSGLFMGGLAYCAVSCSSVWLVVLVIARVLLMLLFAVILISVSSLFGKVFMSDSCLSLVFLSNMSLHIEDVVRVFGFVVVGVLLGGVLLRRRVGS